MQRQELAVRSKTCGFTLQAKEKNKLKSNATLFLYVHLKNYISIVTFTETKLRMVMIKYDFISVFELVVAKWMHVDITVDELCMNL